ncbi:hypothetical protein SAMN05660469_0703 [Fructobacillus pseudoficulneus]|nr:hypothetical protein SAMN05660469_0703 [Fructobacillus pseudoficulneus]
MAGEKSAFIVISMLVILTQAIIVKFSFKMWVHFVVPATFTIVFIVCFFFVFKSDNWLSLIILLLFGNTILYATGKHTKSIL